MKVQCDHAKECDGSYCIGHKEAHEQEAECETFMYCRAVHVGVKCVPVEKEESKNV